MRPPALNMGFLGLQLRPSKCREVVPLDQGEAKWIAGPFGPVVPALPIDALVTTGRAPVTSLPVGWCSPGPEGIVRVDQSARLKIGYFLVEAQ